MSFWENTTREERKAIAAKSAETRRKNIEARKLEEKSRKIYAGSLGNQIAELEKRLDLLQKTEAFSLISCALNNKSLLSTDEIISASIPWQNESGIYFLVEENEIVYVGQSTNIHLRLASHKDKNFSRYSYIACPPEHLDRLESLYIHFLRPRLNGNRNHREKVAPFRFVELVECNVSLELEA